MTIYDVHTQKFTDLFNTAPIYTKSAIVQATLVTELQQVQTIVSEGFLETEATAAIGQYIVTNPDGERYLLSSDTFFARYEHLGGNLYKAIGSIKAFRNPFAGDVEILAPWGEPQFGKADCYFAVALDENDEMITADRYLIEGTAFQRTYKLR